ncbi:hypothetical protein [Shewanella sp. UCD-KL21]|uniref:hypothetical protein n=1 Tax=Shewanella sp. UCD-KL21 TaxID=1917164 RepID=UPI00097145CF|nr:hypothetical protein [Shewanella sp. UCD-KL21]
MKLNKISNALRLSRLNWQPTSALYSSALLTLLSAPVLAQDDVDKLEVAAPTTQVSEQTQTTTSNY